MPRFSLKLDRATPRKLQSVWLGRDTELLDRMIPFYNPGGAVPGVRGMWVDVCCNERRMWKGSIYEKDFLFCDIDPEVKPDYIASWEQLPFSDQSCSLLVFDPPHLPKSAASEKSHQRFAKSFGLRHAPNGPNVSSQFPGFLREAKRVLTRDGFVFAKIKDFINCGEYQWSHLDFLGAAREARLKPFDLIIKHTPTKLESSVWKTEIHVLNMHTYWIVLKNDYKLPSIKRSS